ncbi:MAG: thermonuclease family protein [Gammaproteobacteria bacterium]|nr:thermonuclease family protein [Gammaproteobacteria bacterium]
MKKVIRTLSILLTLMLTVFLLTSCGKTEATTTQNNPVTTTKAPEVATTTTTYDTSNIKDYASEVKLDMSSPRLKQEVTVVNYIDGDTTHFEVPTSVISTGVLKARYLAVNTPESTGKIEEWGKAASNFTKAALKSATSIYVESDTANWDIDSTGSRCLVWVWYRTSESENYRNLNIELLQEGLAIASSSANNSYGEVCMSAIAQAKALKLRIYSGEKDPDFYYGDAQTISLKELRFNITDYVDMKVAFEANVIRTYNNGVYLEDYNDEDDMYYGFYAYYGATAGADLLGVLEIGNRVRIVGSVTYYETGKSYQVSGLSYDIWNEDDPNNTVKIGDGAKAAYTLMTAEEYNSEITLTLEKEVVNEETGEETVESQEKTMTLAEFALNTSVEMKDLYVTSVYTTKSESSSSKGALTLTCKCGDETITVRTEPLYGADGKLITADEYLHHTINVKGIIDTFDGKCQIKVFNYLHITVVS